MYIFFDVDGVLNNQSDWRTPFSLNPQCIHAFAEFINTVKKNITDVQLVICSSWRGGISNNNHHTPQYEHLVAALQNENLTILDSTPLSNKSRQEEIEYYIKKHNI